MRLALGERRRLALPRPLRRGQFRPIPLLLESVPLLAAVLRTLLQTRNLRVLLLDVSSQPADLGLQVFDPFPHGQAEHSHPRYDSRGDGFCPVAFDGVPVSAASDPLNNYAKRFPNESDEQDQIQENGEYPSKCGRGTLSACRHGRQPLFFELDATTRPAGAYTA